MTDFEWMEALNDTISVFLFVSFCFVLYTNFDLLDVSELFST